MIRAKPGATAIPVPLLESRGFSFDLEVFRRSLSSKTKMVMLNSPHNPTGGMIPAEDIAAIADEVRGRDLVVLSDEIYSRIVYGGAETGLDSEPARDAGEDYYSRRFLKDVCDDRLAHGLWRDAFVPGGPHQQAEQEFEFLHGEFHPASGYSPRCADLRNW